MCKIHTRHFLRHSYSHDLWLERVNLFTNVGNVSSESQVCLIGRNDTASPGTDWSIIISSSFTRALLSQWEWTHKYKGPTTYIWKLLAVLWSYQISLLWLFVSIKNHFWSVLDPNRRPPFFQLEYSLCLLARPSWNYLLSKWCIIWYLYVGSF